MKSKNNNLPLPVIIAPQSDFNSAVASENSRQHTQNFRHTLPYINVLKAILHSCLQFRFLPVCTTDYLIHLLSKPCYNLQM